MLKWSLVKMSWNLKRMAALQASEAGPASIQVKHTRSWSKQALLPGGTDPPCPAQHESYADRWKQRRGRLRPKKAGQPSSARRISQCQCLECAIDGRGHFACCRAEMTISCHARCLD